MQDKTEKLHAQALTALLGGRPDKAEELFGSVLARDRKHFESLGGGG